MRPRGWTVYDLGADVKIPRFLEEQKRTGAEVVAISSLMTTSMLAIPEIIRPIKAHDPGDNRGTAWAEHRSAASWRCPTEPTGLP